MDKHIYIAIDLKSFYASVECVERGLDALTTNLVVADNSRTEKTICLAVSPSLKEYGISGRARLFEVIEKVKEENLLRKIKLHGKEFSGSSVNGEELKKNSELSIDYITAPPRMAFYMKYSTKVYSVYLKYFSPDDIHVYSIDEVFIDVTHYLRTYNLTARELVMKIIHDVLETTGITATAGIGTNLYLCKIAMDIVAKHIKPDKDGVRVAELDEMSYRKQLWSHKPITDFWRIGKGYKGRLEQHGLYTMGDIARCSLGEKPDYYCEDLLYKIFGINAELLIDHAWGYEPCTIADIKAYRPLTNSLSSGQVLHCPYDYNKARLIIREMTDQMALDLVDKALVTDQIILDIGYDITNITDKNISKAYHGEIITDTYGRKVPKGSHGSQNIGRYTSSAKLIIDSSIKLFDRIADKNLMIRKIGVTAAHVISEMNVSRNSAFEQLEFFTDYEKMDEQQKREEINFEKEKQMQKAILKIKKRYGKNAVLKGMNFTEGATAISRNRQIGGHKE